MKRVAAAACVALLSTAAGVTGANEILGVYKAWIAQSYGEGGTTVCMMWSQPEKAEGDYTRRGDIYAFLSHRPSERRVNEIRFEAGYAFERDSEVRITIESQVFTLMTDDSTAWLASPAEEEAMVRAMKAGREMLVEGTSSRGTDTRDTYSLFGFSAAHRAITQACS